MTRRLKWLGLAVLAFALASLLSLWSYGRFARHAQGELPAAVLLNGGVFHAHALAERLTQLLGEWRGAPVRVLHNPHPDWAVARGAAAHGLATFESNRPPALAGQAPAAMIFVGWVLAPTVFGDALPAWVQAPTLRDGRRPLLNLE